MTLNEYFQPISFLNIFYLILIFVAFEISGNFIARIFNSPSFLRPVNWVFGFGIWVFVWFVLHLFIPLNQTYILFSLLVLLLPGYSYFKSQRYLELFNIFKNNRWFFIPLIILIPFIIVKSSLPSHQWDEIAYHYYSPARIQSEVKWDFSYQVDPDIPGYYENLPRIFETYFITTFAATKTYFNARLLQLVLFSTALFSGALFLKEYSSRLSAIFFYNISLLYYYVFVYASLSGYIDVGVASFVLLAVLTTIHLIINKKPSTLLSVAALSGMAVAGKYTAISPFISMVLAYIINSIPNFIEHVKTSRKSLPRVVLIFLISVIVFTIFGGYWYAKNYALTKNPVYPFIIPCQIERCYDQIPESNEWLHAVDLSVFNRIYQEVFLYNFALTGLFFAAIILTLKHPNKIIRRISIFMLTLFIIELILLFKAQDGFSIRYFYYYYFLITFFVSLPAIVKPVFKNNFNKLILLYWIIAIITAFTFIIPSIVELYGKRLFRDVDVAYALRKMDIQDWNKYYFPKLHQVVSWCGEDRPMVDLYVFDPGLIWDSGESLFKGLLVNCRMKTLSTHNKDKQIILNELIAQKKPFYIASIYKCGEKDYPSYADDRVTRTLNQVNQSLVCMSNEVTNRLYYFDPTKLKINP